MDFIRYVPRRYAVISGCLGTSVDFIRYVLRRYAVISGRLGTAMDFIRYVPRRYAVISGRLGTSVDFIRYILRRCFDLWRIIAGKLLPVPKRLTEAEIHGVQRLGSCFLCLNGLLKQKSMEYVGWKQASCA